MLGIPQYLWRLLPGNPILLRVVALSSKRVRDLVIRCVYLGVLVAFVIFQLLVGGSSLSGASLDTLSATSTRIFEQLSYLQLALVALLAPIFTAGAITQEKDSQTYDILLATPLTNGQIVLGTMMSRLFFIFALLVSGIPVFSITQVFGGVAIASIVTSFLIAAATALVCGALAMAIATFKVGTRRTIFSFYMVVVLYLLGTLLLDRLDAFKVPLVDPTTGAPSAALSSTGWLTALNPFLALRTIFREPAYTPPSLAVLPGDLRGFFSAWMLTQPASFFVTAMTATSVVLVLPAIVLLRRLAQSSFSVRAWILRRLRLGGAANRKPRTVWSNPIAWREARTKASAGRASLLRYGFVLAGLGGAIWMLALHGTEAAAPNRWIDRGSFNAAERTLHVLGGDVYAITTQTKVKLRDQDVPIETLAGRFEVVDLLPTIRGGVREVGTITIAEIPRGLSHDQVRQFLLGLVVLELAVILLIVTNAAASTVTREKEDGTLDLLLTTPITSRYYIWGKLRGLVSFALPLLAVPLLSVAMVVGFDTMRRLSGGGIGQDWLVLPEALLVLPGLLVIVVAFAAIIGMQMSLRFRTTVQAVMSSLGIVLGAFALLGWCGNLFVNASSSTTTASLVFGSFSPFTVLTLLIWPQQFAGAVYGPGGDPLAARVVVVLFTLAATAAYAGGVYMMYRSMVTNFDMTIRRQSR
jgi:ABC-type transport system involved in multi-copper enzyme maturation permease subunit